MSAYTPSPAFQNAAKYLSIAPSLSAVSNTIKLELYGLFKYLTASPAPTTSRPSIFDYTGRAKWDAWSTTAQKYGDRAAEAESRYIAIARELGWHEEMASQENIWDSDSERDSGEEGIWKSDAEMAQSSRGGGGEGMGNIVSTMVTHEGEEDQSVISVLAISGTAEDMLSYLNKNPEVDVNEADENGYTALHLACDRGNIAVAQLLLSRGADMNIKDADDFTALELADISGHDDIVELLKSTKVKPD